MSRLIVTGVPRPNATAAFCHRRRNVIPLAVVPRARADQEGRARTNRETPNNWSDETAAAVERAADEVIRRASWNQHLFPCQFGKPGVARKSNMNANEVIAGRAN